MGEGEVVFLLCFAFCSCVTILFYFYFFTFLLLDGFLSEDGLAVDIYNIYFIYYICTLFSHLRESAC